MTTSRRSVTRLAPGKVNLTLDVLERRADGYHEIESIMQTIALADQVTVTLAERPGVTLAVDGPFASGVPTDESNLAHRAATALFDALGEQARGVAMSLTKNLPSQAGLGGGSSDAAAVLLALNDLFDSPLTVPDLIPIAATLGSDVPFFVRGGVARVTGRGDRIAPCADGLTGPLVLVKPPVGVSTAAAYAALDALPGRISARATRDWPSSGVSNDFEAVVYAMALDIAAARDALLAAGATQVLLCGSGATVAGFGGDAAAIAAQVTRAAVGHVWLTGFSIES